VNKKGSKLRLNEFIITKPESFELCMLPSVKDTKLFENESIMQNLDGLENIINMVFE